MKRQASKDTKKIGNTNFKHILAAAEKELIAIYHQSIQKSSVILQKVGKQLEKAGAALAASEKPKTTTKKTKTVKPLTKKTCGH